MRLHAGPVPLYFQLQRHLRERIEAGELTPGTAMPTEEALCAKYGVSRITVRHALDGLLASGVIARRRGARPVVATPGGPLKSVILVGSLDEMLTPARDLSVRVLHREVVRCSPEVSRALRLPKGERVLRLERLHASGGQPFAYAHVHLPEALGASVSDGKGSGGAATLHAIETALGQPVVRAEQKIEPAVADRTVAAALRVRPRSPVLKVWRTYYLASDEPVETVTAWYHPRRYEYTIRLFPRAPMS